MNGFENLHPRASAARPLRRPGRAPRWLAVVAAAGLTGCAVGPDYVRPDLRLPARYTAEAEASPAADGRTGPPPQRDIPAQWWAAFRSPPLNALVAASLAGNPNVEAAQAALRAARAALQAEQAAYAPTASLSYAPTRQRVADDVASASYYTLHTAQLSVSYVPDVFGATRRQVESAQAQAELQRFQLEATTLTLSANVVAAAITEAGLRAQRSATLAIIASQQDVLHSIRRQLAWGQAAPADVSAQEAALALAEASLPPIDKQLAQQRNLLTTLAGRYPADEVEAHFELAGFTLPAELPSTLPSTLVEHRPDVRAAEAQLQAASAGIGIAVAARLPSVTLGVNSVGSSAESLARLFASPTMFWTLAAGVTQPLFDGGALKQREAAARASFDQAAAQYRATVLSAYQDVANSLQAIDADTRALRAAEAAQRATAANLARLRRQVQLGDASPLALWLAQQGEQQALLTRVQAQATQLTDAAALFQALGGGWWNRPDGPAPVPAPASAR